MAEWLVEDLFVLHHLHLVWREQAYEMVNLAATEIWDLKYERWNFERRPIGDM